MHYYLLYDVIQIRDKKNSKTIWNSYLHLN